MRTITSDTGKRESEAWATGIVVTCELFGYDAEHGAKALSPRSVPRRFGPGMRLRYRPPCRRLTALVQSAGADRGDG